MRVYVLLFFGLALYIGAIWYNDTYLARHDPCSMCGYTYKRIGGGRNKDTGKWVGPYCYDVLMRVHEPEYPW